MDARSIAGSDLAWTDQTTIHPLGALALVVLSVLLMTVRRTRALLPFVVLACMVSPAQRIAVVNIDFTLLRILVMVGWIRVMMRSEYVGLRPLAMDGVVIAYSVVRVIAYVGLRDDVDAIIYIFGQTFDTVGMYFLFRCTIRSVDDIRWLTLALAFFALLSTAFFLAERAAGRNPFAFFGGVPFQAIVRDGAIRAQGPFPHPIIAGCFWAGVVPLLIGAAVMRRRGRALPLIAAAAIPVIIVCTASSTPLASVAAGCGAALLYRFRRRLPMIQVVALLGAVMLHLVMKQPVWHLVARIDLVGGSTGWHRFMLIDQAIRRVGEWWLLGIETTGHWGRGLQDITNQYVLEGVRGGLLSLILFCTILALAFREVHLALQRTSGRGPLGVTAWFVGAALFVHAVSFLSISYFGQINVLLYATLAATAAVGAASRGARDYAWPRSTSSS